MLFTKSKHKMLQMSVRKIVHIDMDAFYASVEQRDDPRLRGKPVVVAWRGKRSVVCAASYEARSFGVRSAMPALRAEHLCPDAIFVPPDFPRYRDVSRRTREIFKLHTDLVEPLSLDEAYLDVTENKTGLPTATRVARSIREQIREELQLTASAGVAPNKFLAKIASDWRKPDGLFVIQPEEIDTFLPPLPVGRIPGVGKVTEKRLEELGIKTVGDLRSLELSSLEARFGRYGARLYELARGIDHNPVVPDRPTKSISAEDTFEEDIPLHETEPVIRRSQAQDERIQYPHAQPHPGDAARILRRADSHCSIAAGPGEHEPATALSSRGRWPQQFSRIRRNACSVHPLRLTAFSSRLAAKRKIQRTGAPGAESDALDLRLALPN